MRRLLLMILSCLATHVHGQSPLIDSLQQRVYRAKPGDEKIAAIIALCSEYKSINRDTLDLYAYAARDMAIHSDNKRLQQEAELVVGYDYFRWGWMDSAIATLQPLIDANANPASAQRDLYFKASRIKAMSYATHSRYQEGLTILYKVVEEAEKEHDSLVVAENSNSIASIALARNQTRDAFTWLNRALTFTGRGKESDGIRASILVNLADAYFHQDRIDSAQYYIQEGIDLFRKDRNYFNLAFALQRQSAILIKAGKLDAAEAVLKDMLKVRQMLADSPMYQDQNLALVNFYIETNQVQKAVDACKEWLQTGNLLIRSDSNSSGVYANNINIRLGYYEALARCYKILGRDSLYQSTLENIIAAKDSFYQYNSASAIAELETKYEVQKKENTIIQQKLDITQKNNRFYALAGIFGFAGVLGAILFFGFRKRKRIELAAMLEKEKLEAAQSVARAEENERKRIAADLHDNLGAYAASMMSNIDVVEPVATASPAVASAIQALRSNSFQIVSQLNDTIWVLKKDALRLTAISDRIKVFVQRIEKSYPEISINVTEQIEKDILLSPGQGFHLFRIVQEAVNNALRHSKTKKITIHMLSNEQEWKLAVLDEGIGLGAGAFGGNGMENMRDRAREAGWDISWHPGLAGGTMVIVSPGTTN